MSQYRFKAQANASLRHRVADEIRTAIIQGNLKPGDKLRELDISEQMGVSRGPIREAIRDLEAMGLVICHPYRETVVADVSREQIVELIIPIRLQLEIFSLKSGFREYDDEFYQSLERIIETMKTHAERQDLFALIEEDIRFHEMIVNFKGDAFTLQIWNSIVNRLRIHFIKNTPLFDDLGKVVQDHSELLEALKSQDEERIVKQWRTHIQHDDSLLCFT
ncbi:GntR family transcriptional regulator [Paenibacillus contaminans]|uniref:GntR family transcriptional regulator n=1 Tax=Paenibacillus contaminans TaxID=450362 RepID=A0A329MR09_9BACL|nr:GntR family transcriptional regulator [Paenibacillus contaminans]RAV21970.1 GntR family transcriptional regulator [Paenibacillus contaminans]